MNRTTSVLLLALIAFATALCPVTAENVTLFVSPNGSDKAPGTKDKPLKTLGQVQQVIRKLEAGNGDLNVSVALRGGRYYLPAGLTLSSKDSGSENRPVVYSNYSGEVPVLVGGSRVTSWKPYKSGIYMATVPEIKKINPTEFEVLENGVPGVLARSPNEGWFRLENPVIEPYWSFCYKPGEISPAKWNISQLQVHLIQMGTYFSEHIPIVKVDPKERRLYTKFKMGDKFYNPVAGKTYTIENALELLDAPGEYFADHKKGILYYYPYSQTINKSIIETSVSNPSVSIIGDSADDPVQQIVLKGLCFMGGQNQVVLKNARNIVVQDCRLLNAAQDSIKLLAGAVNNRITGCEIYNVGVNGIRLQGDFPDPKTGKKMSAAADNQIDNNYIHQIGRLSISGNGIYLVNACNRNLITNNLITDTTKSGILMFSMWDIPREWGVMNDNVISNNELSRCVTQSWDGGAFYIGATTDNTTFQNNKIADAWSFFNTTWPQPEDRPDDVCSIDFDPGLTFMTHIRNNMIYGANSSTFENGRFEDETLLSNNYFETLDQPGQIMFNGVWTELTKVQPEPFASAKVQKNIGLTPEFKYPYPKESARPVTLPFKCSFEGTISPFYLYKYDSGFRFQYIQNKVAKDGKSAFTIDRDVSVIRYRHPQPINNRVSIWIYDNPAKKKASCYIKLSGLNNASAALGIQGPGKYVSTVNGKQVAAKLDRKAGWHELVFDFTSHPERGCAMSIDGWAYGEAPGLTKFDWIEIGDGEFSSDSRGISFDNLVIE